MTGKKRKVKGDVEPRRGDELCSRGWRRAPHPHQHENKNARAATLGGEEEECDRQEAKSERGRYPEGVRVVTLGGERAELGLASRNLHKLFRIPKL